jgi:hypothetical protein
MKVPWCPKKNMKVATAIGIRVLRFEESPEGKSRLQYGAPGAMGVNSLRGPLDV